MSPAHSDTPLNVIYGLHLGDRRWRYVGLTRKGIGERLRGHIDLALRRGVYPVHHWIRKHGSENVVAEILEVCEPHELSEREKYWIARLKAEGHQLLNLTVGGDGTSGYRHTQETKNRMSEARTGKVRTAEHCENLSKALKGKPKSEAARQKASEAKRGERHPNFGKQLSESTRQRISAANKGQVPTPEAIERIKKYNAQHVWTAEERAKLSRAKLGNTNGRRSSHVRWHTNKSVSKPDTCKYCKEEVDALHGRQEQDS